MVLQKYTRNQGNHPQIKTGFHPVWYAILQNCCKNHFSSVLHLYILFYLTVFYLRAQTLKYRKEPNFPPLDDCFDCILPRVQAHVKHLLNGAMFHMCLASLGGPFPLNVKGGEVRLFLGNLLYNQQNTKHTKRTQHTAHTTRWATLSSPPAASHPLSLLGRAVVPPNHGAATHQCHTLVMSHRACGRCCWFVCLGG